MFEMNKEQEELFNELTPLQKEVSLNSISGMNDIDAYKNSKGKSKTERAMRSSVGQILSKLEVSRFIKSMANHKVNHAIMGREEMMERLSNLSRVTMGEIITFQTQVDTDEEGKEVEQTSWTIKDSALQSANAMAAISEVTAGKEGFKIKQHSPLSAMKQLADLAGYEAPKKVETKTAVVSIPADATPEDASKAYHELMGL